MPVDPIATAVSSLPSLPKTGVVADLLDWYDRHARDLPWRVPPNRRALPHPYRVWLSETMLQQTTVATVRSRYDLFLRRWPTIADLAAADDADVMAAWAGLGYYARARNLIACARLVAAHGGQFPATEQELRQLPGVGAYTAAAIAAIAFGQRAVVIDANIERVVARLLAVQTPLPAAKPLIRQHADALWPDQRSGDFAQALMDLGATICGPRKPQCDQCPLATSCDARAQGLAGDLPRKAPKAVRPVRYGRCWILHHDGRIWLVRREQRGMLGGMRALPGTEWTDGAPKTGKIDADATHLGQIRHIFTHFELRLDVDLCHISQADADQHGPGEWWPLTSIDQAGLPTLYRKALLLLDDGGLGKG